ncbi:hypothetical protein RIF29_14239 [Crotalaria pallida]|uniref:Uncharacterized protein n=1 Tax=Crotalaria pallida TaxID=3830 RepID=A0AAN9II25_CROPI
MRQKQSLSCNPNRSLFQLKSFKHTVAFSIPYQRKQTHEKRSRERKTQKKERRENRLRILETLSDSKLLNSPEFNNHGCVRSLRFLFFFLLQKKVLFLFLLSLLRNFNFAIRDGEIVELKC